MTTMQKVDEIKAAIAALPKEYRSLVVAEQTFEANHPIIYAVILIGFGVLVGIGLALRF